MAYFDGCLTLHEYRPKVHWISPLRRSAHWKGQAYASVRCWSVRNAVSDCKGASSANQAPGHLERQMTSQTSSIPDSKERSDTFRSMIHERLEERALLALQLVQTQLGRRQITIGLRSQRDWQSEFGGYTKVYEYQIRGETKRNFLLHMWSVLGRQLPMHAFASLLSKMPTQKPWSRLPDERDHLEMTPRPREPWLEDGIDCTTSTNDPVTALDDDMQVQCLPVTRLTNLNGHVGGCQRFPHFDRLRESRLSHSPTMCMLKTSPCALSKQGLQETTSVLPVQQLVSHRLQLSNSFGQNMSMSYSNSWS